MRPAGYKDSGLIMKIIGWTEFLENALPNRSAVTVGVFDGVHRGHRALIERVVSHNAEPVVVTFLQSHHKKNAPRDIISFRQKTAMFEILGVKLTIVVEFTPSFRHMAGQDFLRTLHEHGNMAFLAVGSNFHCGYKLDTDARAVEEFCARNGIEACVMPPMTESPQGGASCGLPISSSQIRAAIAGGDLKSAASMLGYPFTVDLAAREGRILPPPGAYSVFLVRGEEKQAAEIVVERENIVIGGDLPDGKHGWEYAEFLPV